METTLIERCRPVCQPSDTTDKKASSELTLMSSANDTTYCDVYKINPQNNLRNPVAIGANGEAVIAEALRMVDLVDLSNIPTPYRLMWTAEGTDIECGKQFLKSKSIEHIPTAKAIQDKLKEIGVSMLVVMRIGWDSNVYIDYGRKDKVEFTAIVHHPTKAVM